MRKLIQPIKRALRPVFYVPMIKTVLIHLPLVCKIYPGCERKHPFDKQFRVDTSGFVPPEKIHSDPAVRAQINPYSASQVGVIRAAIKALGDVNGYSFVDIGCGKGRATLVASEYPFREIVGVELSVDLANTATRNATLFRKAFPDRTAIRIHNQNILDFEFPQGKLALYMYHALGRELMEKVACKLETALASGMTTHAFVIYCNPVFSDALDRSQLLSRWFAKTIACDAEEAGFGPDVSDTVVIWQSGGQRLTTPHSEVNRPIIIVYEDLKAELGA